LVLVSIYIHGSVAFNCFKWNKSDIDLIVVVNHRISEKNKLDLLSILNELRAASPIKGFEMSVVLLQFCRHFEYPTPYELHFSNDCLALYLKNPLALCSTDIKTDPDLAAHFTVINHTGVVLCGQPISEVFGIVPRENYI